MFADLNGDDMVDETEIIQENHYYPFGMNMEGGWNTGTNQYQYNGKEIDNDFGIDWYHYGARMFDPAVGRFTGVDPIADRFAWVSTYNYAENEPIANIDLHGLQKFRKVDKPIDIVTTAPHNFIEGMKVYAQHFKEVVLSNDADPSDFHDSGNTHEGTGIEMLESASGIDGSGQLPLDNAKGGSEVIVETQDIITTTAGNTGGFVRNNSKGAGMVRDFV